MHLELGRRADLDHMRKTGLPAAATPLQRASGHRPERDFRKIQSRTRRITYRPDRLTERKRASVTFPFFFVGILRIISQKLRPKAKQC